MSSETKHTKTWLLGVIYKGLYYPIMLGSKNHIKINHYYRTLIKQSVYWKVRPFCFFRCSGVFWTSPPSPLHLGPSIYDHLTNLHIFVDQIVCCHPWLRQYVVAPANRYQDWSLWHVWSLCQNLGSETNDETMLLFKETSETWCEWKFR